MILLVTANQKLFTTVTQLLPNYRVLCVPDKAGIQAHFATFPTNPTLILVDTQPDLTQLVECRQAIQTISKTFGSYNPIIAIINNITLRELVLNAGADDYLLTPLLRAEVKARVTNYIHPAFRSLDTLIETLYLTTKPLSSKAFNQGIKNLAQIFNASSAWLLLKTATDETCSLVASYNLPSPFKDNPNPLYKEATQIFGQQDMPAPQITKAKNVDNFFPYHLSIPLNNQTRLMGLLQFAYPEAPKLLPSEQWMFTRLGKNIGSLMGIFNREEEAQINATHNAFVVLVARMLGKQLDLNTNLGFILELATPMLSATGSNVWLLSKDRTELNLASSLSPRLLSNPPITHRTVDQGVTGWVVKHKQPLQIFVPTDDPRFDPAVDYIPGTEQYCLLAIPLQYQEEIFGVITIYKDSHSRFSSEDQTLLESIAALTASTISGTQMMQDLREYAEQQRILYEMSQQIAGGLELKETLKQALHWLIRLSNTEIGLLWLIEETSINGKEDKLRLEETLGIDLSQEEPLVVTIEHGMVLWVAKHGKTLIVNDPANDPKIEMAVCNRLKLMPRNVISIPMIYNEKVLGVICLLNKIDGPFNNNDVTLLSTAIEMVTIAIGNARLHTKTVELITERERLHKQVLQTERMATVGRLTASLSHEINNPMQAIQGALSLAMEELYSPDDLETYITLCLHESSRVIKLVNWMRQIYRPQAEEAGDLDITHLLQEAVTIAKKELKRQKIRLTNNLASELAPINATANQLHLVFLSLILNLGDAVSLIGGGELQVASRTLPKTVQVEISVPAAAISSASWSAMFEAESLQKEVDLKFGLSLSYDIITAHNGTITLNRQEQQSVCCLEFPRVPGD